MERHSSVGAKPERIETDINAGIPAVEEFPKLKQRLIEAENGEFVGLFTNVAEMMS